MDGRLFIVFLPVIVAGSWALYNVGRLALQQFKRFSS